MAETSNNSTNNTIVPIKVSDITVSDIAKYIRIDNPDEDETAQLTTFLSVAKNFCASYTGIKLAASEEGEESLDDYPDMVIVIYVLCQDMYDNRSEYVDDKLTPNKVVQTILDMHTRNNIA